jgi:hypothetical protein
MHAGSRSASTWGPIGPHRNRRRRARIRSPGALIDLVRQGHLGPAGAVSAVEAVGGQLKVAPRPAKAAGSVSVPTHPRDKDRKVTNTDDENTSCWSMIIPSCAGIRNLVEKAPDIEVVGRPAMALRHCACSRTHARRAAIGHGNARPERVEVAQQLKQSARRAHSGASAYDDSHTF